MKPMKIMNALNKICPDVAGDIAYFYDLPVTEYIKNIFSSNLACQSYQASLFREYLTASIAKNVAENQRDAFARDFMLNPIIQTAPHCQLYLDKMNFYAVILSCVGSILTRKNHLIAIHSSAVTLESRRKFGPAWLNLKKANINLLELANSRLQKYSVCAVDSTVSINPNAFVSALSHADADEVSGLKFFQTTLSYYEGSLSRYFLESNKNLIKKMDRSNAISPILLDENVIVDLVVKLLSDTNSLIYRLILDPVRREKLDENFCHYASLQRGNFVVNGTYYFWGVRDGKIRKLKFHAGYLIEETLASGIKIKFDQANVISALQEGAIIPNLFLMYLVMSVIPQVKVIGGTRQIAYLPCFKQTLLSLLQSDIEDERELKEEILKTRTNYWGAKLIENLPPPIEFISHLGSNCCFDDVIELLSGMTLEKVSAGLLAFQDHPKWSVLYE